MLTSTRCFWPIDIDRFNHVIYSYQNDSHKKFRMISKLTFLQWASVAIGLLQWASVAIGLLYCDHYRRSGCCCSYYSSYSSCSYYFSGHFSVSCISITVRDTILKFQGHVLWTKRHGSMQPIFDICTWSFATSKWWEVGSPMQMHGKCMGDSLLFLITFERLVALKILKVRNVRRNKLVIFARDVLERFLAETGQNCAPARKFCADR